MRVLHDLEASGQTFSGEDVAFLSPYMTSGIKRFGDYKLDLKKPAEDWLQDRELRKAAKEARSA